VIKNKKWGDVVFSIQKEMNYSAKADGLIVGIFEKPNKFEGILKKLDDQFQGGLTELVKDGDLSAKKKSLETIHTFGKIGAKRLIIVGLGKEKEFSIEILREAIGRAFKAAKKAKLCHVAIFIDSFLSKNTEGLDTAHTIGEAAALATYQYPSYKQKSNEPERDIENISVYCDVEDIHGILESIKVGYVYGKSTNFARTLVNLPGNLLTAADLANVAMELGEKSHFEVEILEKEDMLKLGMGAILAVNQGSAEPPKMIVLRYQGKKEWTDVIGFVGKGITFDTGGYSIKTKAGIVGMKTDMGGAAAVLGAMQIIGELKPEQNVVAVIPATDNMISGTAFKPDDVITSMSGKTIEVLNTDAEGRLALADAITYAKHHGANYLIDVATLTGGVIVALGNHTTGAMTNNEVFFEQVLEASLETGEQIWRLPLFEKDKERVRNSKLADLNNSPGREGHAIMGGAFIGEFAEETPWVHLDIAGTATTEQTHDLGPSGATGVMTRTLALLVERFHPIK